MDRRGFIKSALGLAALTVAGVNAPSLLAQRSIQEQVSSGLVENQIFYIDEPIVIDIDNVKIRNCRFIVNTDLPNVITVLSESFQITNCDFELLKDNVGPVIKISNQTDFSLIFDGV